MRKWQLLGSVQLAVALSLASGLPGAAQESVENVDEWMSGRVDESEQPIHPSTHLPIHPSTPTPALTVSDWVAQIEAALVQITGVRIETTEAGLQILLDTAEGTLAAPTTQTVGNALIADIPNAVLALPEGGAFEQFGPAEGIALVSVTNEPGDRVRVAITGTDAPPVAEVTATGLAVTLGEAVVGAEDDAIQVVVTGEQDGYRVPNASVGTLTETPLRDIPQSIQVVPRQVLRDRQARSLIEGLESASGVVSTFAPAGSRNTFTIRGFENGQGFLVNGLPDPRVGADSSFIYVDRLEVLRGPASVLYGQSPLGGRVNIVTKQPLEYPFYEASATVGSFSTYQGAVDLSGPVNDSRTILYRLNAGYRNFGSFLEFDEGNSFAIAPNLTVRLGPNTDLTIEGDVNFLDRNGQQPEGQPAEGTVLPNPNGRISRSFNPQGPQANNFTTTGRFNYRLEHQLNNNWRIRNAFLYSFYDDDDRGGEPAIFNGSLAADQRTLNRRFFIGSQFFDDYYLDTNMLGNISTGSIEHQILLGFSLSRNEYNGNFEFGNAAPVDIFNPVFDQTIASTGQPNFVRNETRDVLGIYLQDQINFSDNLKVLIGGRLDIYGDRTRDLVANQETNQSGTAFSPRIGIVYQPITPISLYANFSRSFAPTIGVSASGEAFQPERGTQYEIGMKTDISARLSLNLALYDLTRSNITTADPDNPFFSIQTGEQRSRGVELDVSGEILPGWNIIGGYSYTDAKVTEDNNIPVGNRLRAAPEHSFNLWTTYRLQEGSFQGLGVGLGLLYVGDRQGDLANTFELPSYLRTDAAIFYEREQFRAALNIKNLFDIDYYATARSRVRVDPGAPLTMQATVSWQF
jgi:iron complex outermembrane receptor protein